MSDLAATLVHRRDRVNEIARVAARYGFADWVERSGAGTPGSLLDRISAHVADPDLVGLSQGERLRGALIQIHDADGAVDHLVDGLMAASSMLASAQLLSRRTGPTVGGISLPGIAAVGVSVVTWRRLLAKRAGHQSIASRARRLSSKATSG